MPGTEEAFELGYQTLADNSESRIAMVAAVSTEMMLMIDAQANAAGLRVKAVVPVELASFVLARTLSKPNATVVGTTPAGMFIDVILDSHFACSRTIVHTLTPETAEKEIVRTVALASSKAMPEPETSAVSAEESVVNATEILEYLSGADISDRKTFTMDLPSEVSRRLGRRLRLIAARAILAAVLAIGFASFVVFSRGAALMAQVSQTSRQWADLNQMWGQEKVVAHDLNIATQANGLLDLGFQPAQRSADLITAAAFDAPTPDWVTKLSFERGKPMVIQGIGRSHKAVAQYVAALSTDARFRDVTLVKAKKGLLAQVDIVQFSISARPIGSFPIDDPAILKGQPPAGKNEATTPQMPKPIGGARG